jgi:hypothetical protein
MVSSAVKGSRDEKVGEYVWQDKMFSITLFATYIFYVVYSAYFCLLMELSPHTQFLTIFC